MITYPKAENFAENMRPLPVKTDPVTMELYGYAATILDVEAAKLQLTRAGFFGNEQRAAMEILEERAERMGGR